jgi:uncharacterized protein YjiS (DUF1127 family)
MFATHSRPFSTTPTPPGLFARAVDLAITWIARARSRAILGTLDDRMLRDIGLHRANVDGELSKPFWKR